MKRRVLSLLAAGTVTLVACSDPPPPPSSVEVKPKPPAPLAVDPCALPTAPSATPEETAWKIFVAINCPSKDSIKPLVWETWTEQTCLLNPSSPACSPGSTARTLHASGLAQKPTNPTVPISDECSPMLTTATAVGPFAPLAPFVPTNLGTSPQFCEEVFVNASELAYVNAPAPGQSLRSLTGQNTYVSSGATINFPTTALEVKADWVPASSLDAASVFNCTTPPAGLYTETIDGVCYALVGMHISSKLYPNWLWATFEPQVESTNPNRCKPDLYGECVDAWGSNPATSQGADTAQTPALAALMTSAKLAPAFSNYRLSGAQIDFTNATVTGLGSSFVEFNAQVLPGQASCITCHYSARFDNSTTPPTPGAGAPPAGSNMVGVPTPQPPNLISEDFSWFIAFMPQTPPR